MSRKPSTTSGKVCKDLDLKKANEDNERQLEQFVTRIEAEFPGQAIVQRQRLSKWAVRTTRWNYLFTVPGESDEQVVLVAHYDTWRGLATLTGWLMDWSFDRWPGFALWVASHPGITITAIILLEFAILLHLMARRIPAWIDNSYKHANRADNLGSLKRVGGLAAQPSHRLST